MDSPTSSMISNFWLGAKYFEHYFVGPRWFILFYIYIYIILNTINILELCFRIQLSYLAEVWSFGLLRSTFSVGDQSYALSRTHFSVCWGKVPLSALPSRLSSTADWDRPCFAAAQEYCLWSSPPPAWGSFLTGMCISVFPKTPDPSVITCSSLSLQPLLSPIFPCEF